LFGFDPISRGALMRVHESWQTWLALTCPSFGCDPELTMSLHFVVIVIT